MKTYDVIIVGAGPAGLGAAIEVAKAGGQPLLIDENPKAGGQLFKQIHKFFGSKEHYAGMRGYEIGEMLLEEAQGLGVEIQLNTRVWGIFEDGSIATVSGDQSKRYKGKYLILATGAIENNLSFPGCTLPGVMTAGSAQSLMNLYQTLPGKSIVVVGSGNVGLIVTYQLMQAGANVKAIVDTAPRISGYEVHAGKVRRGGVPIYLGSTVKEARGSGQVEQVVITEIDQAYEAIPGTEKVIEADTICLAVGMTPRIELAVVGKCHMAWSASLGGKVPLHSSMMETSQSALLIAGDITGIEEASTALDEGRIAGVMAANKLGYLSQGEFEKKKLEIETRLDQLRMGPHGENRQRAKEEIWKAMERRVLV